MNYLPYDASLPLFGLLRRIGNELSDHRPASVAYPVIRSLLHLHEVATAEQSRDQIVHGLVVSICPLGGNGLGDAVIWSACRAKSLHQEAENLTSVTNDLRGQLYDLNRSHQEILASKVEEVKAALVERFGAEQKQQVGEALNDLIHNEFASYASNTNDGGIDAQLKALLVDGLTCADILNRIAKQL